MKLQTIIVEDVLKSQQALQTMLETYCPRVEIIGAASTAQAAIDLIRREQPDLVMLDIELRLGNGFEVLENLPNFAFEVIFTTAYDRYALKAIKFSALDYLLKPISIKELIGAVDKAIQRRQDQQMRARYDMLMQNLRSPQERLRNLAVPTINGYEMVLLSDVMRCEGDEGYTQLMLQAGRSIMTTRRLKEWEELLEDQGFFRIHRSHLINLNFLKRYSRGSGGCVIMTDGTEILVSRRRKEAFLQRLGQW